jgi:methylenetetrahydrofolate dehydrogenase (NADP+)/methenyltetrahydrofolate cyclohydrolase
MIQQYNYQVNNLIDGRALAERLYTELTEYFTDRDRPTRVALVYAGNNPAIESFIKIKQRIAKRLGIELMVERFADDVSQEQLIDTIDMLHRAQDANGQKTYEGMIVQLPLPDHIDTKNILAAIPPQLDIDVLNPATGDIAADCGLWTPVVGAVREILRRHHIDISGQSIVVVGNGELVGRPTVQWLRGLGVDPIVIEDDVMEHLDEMQKAGIVISGVGKPGLITPGMLNPRAVVIDAGTSESAGKVSGDCAIACRDHVQLITPVPGGVGPLTVAILFRNLRNALECR